MIVGEKDLEAIRIKEQNLIQPNRPVPWPLATAYIAITINVSTFRNKNNSYSHKEKGSRCKY